MSSLIVEVCKIEEVIKHPNADKLSCVRIKGWWAITGLDQYKVNDLVVFVPPDSILPNELIEKYQLTYLKGKNRITTQKLRGFVSQGLVLDLPDGNWKVGDDVAKILGITKYEPPEPPSTMRGNQVSKKKLNPAFDIYTDIENVKHFNNVFEDGEMVVITEKIHGTNSRFGNLLISLVNKKFWDKIFIWIKMQFGQTHEFVWGSHNVQLQGTDKQTWYGTDVYGQTAKKYNLKNICPKNTLIYGEIYGKGIQKNYEYGLEDQRLLVFDMKDANGNYWDWKAVVDFCKENDLQTVPILYIGPYKTDILEKCTVGMSVICPTQVREGAVVKCLKESNHPRIGRKILKSINPDYLMRKNATEFH